MHLLLLVPLLIGTAASPPRPTCTLLLQQLLPLATSEGFAHLRATPDSRSDGTYYSVQTRASYARDPDSRYIRTFEPYGQVFEVVEVGGRPAAVVAWAPRVLVVWWGYGMSRQRTLPHAAVRVPAGEVSS